MMLEGGHPDLDLSTTRPGSGGADNLAASAGGILSRTLFKSKIHRATVTEANLEYEGSITIDGALLEAADILQYEWVAVWNVTRGSRIETYALRGEPGSGVVCVNGAAAHHFSPGEVVIVATRCELSDEEARTHVPTVVLVDAGNHVKDARYEEVPGPGRRGV